MAKFTGIRIHLGAAHDDVGVFQGGVETTHIDRSEMRKLGYHKAQGQLRRAVVEAWEAKDEDRRARRENARIRDKQRQAGRSAKQKWTATAD